MIETLEVYRLLLHNGGKECYVWNTGDPLLSLLVVPCSEYKVYVKLQLLVSKQDDKGPRQFRNEVISHSSKKRTKNLLRYLLMIQGIYYESYRKLAVKNS